MKVTLNTIFIKVDILFDKWNIKAKLEKYNSCSQKFYLSKNNYFIFILKNYILQIEFLQSQAKIIILCPMLK